MRSEQGQLTAVLLAGRRYDFGIPVRERKILTDAGAQAANRLRRVAFKGVVDVAEHVSTIFEQIGDAFGPFIQQFFLRSTNGLVVGEGVTVVAYETDVERKERVDASSGSLPIGIRIRLASAFDNDESDPSLHQEAGKGSGHEISGPDFDGEGNIWGECCQVVDEIGQEAPGAAAGKGSRELDEAWSGDGAERTYDIQIGCS